MSDTKDVNQPLDCLCPHSTANNGINQNGGDGGGHSSSDNFTNNIRQLQNLVSPSSTNNSIYHVASNSGSSNNRNGGGLISRRDRRDGGDRLPPDGSSSYISNDYIEPESSLHNFGNNSSRQDIFTTATSIQPSPSTTPNIIRSNNYVNNSDASTSNNCDFRNENNQVKPRNLLHL